MKKIKSSALLGAVVCLAVSGSAFANSVSYYLDKSNLSSQFPNNTNYLQVTIDDNGKKGKINFTVTPLEPLTSIAGSHFGVDKFAFIAPFSGLSFVKSNNDWLSGWSLKKDKKNSIFGKYDMLASGSGNNNSNPLAFSLRAGKHTLEDYIDALTDGPAFFTAHVRGLSAGCGNYQGEWCGCDTVKSGLFGGSTLASTSAVPVPAAAWLFTSGLIGMVGVSRRARTKLQNT